MSSTALLAQAQRSLRCIDWQDITLALLTDSRGSRQTFELSRPVDYGEKIDFFMSHSWHDNPKVKFDALTIFVKEFVAKHGRSPTIWLDKVCIDQDNISDGLKVLPVNVMACNKMLVLCGDTYVQRLWCAWELFTLFSFQGHEQALAKVELIPLLKPHESMGKGARMLKSAEDTQKESEDFVLNQLLHFNVQKAKTYDPNEEGKLRDVIRACGEAKFNTNIRHMAKAAIDDRKLAPSSRSFGSAKAGLWSKFFRSRSSSSAGGSSRLGSKVAQTFQLGTGSGRKEDMRPRTGTDSLNEYACVHDRSRTVTYHRRMRRPSSVL